MARYRRDTLVLHDGAAQARRIPRTFNTPGHPDGVAGPEPRARMTEHAQRFGAEVAEARVEAVERQDGLFHLSGSGRAWLARTLILAAGDVVEGLSQISVAMGHGAVAATRAHNWLRQQNGEKG